MNTFNEHFNLQVSLDIINFFQVVQQSNNIENLSLKEFQFEQAQKVIQPIEAPLRTFYLSTVICNDCLIYVKFIQKKKDNKFREKN